MSKPPVLFETLEFAAQTSRSGMIDGIVPGVTYQRGIPIPLVVERSPWGVMDREPNERTFKRRRASSAGSSGVPRKIRRLNDQ